MGRSLLDIMVDPWTLLRLHGSSTPLVHILVATVHADSNRCHKSAWSLSQGSMFYTTEGSKSMSSMCNGDGMPLKTGSTYICTYVWWRHLFAAFQMRVSEAVHVGMSPVRRKWCQEPLREKHVSGIHHCCAGSQMSPAPAACLPPFALPPLAHL